MPSGSSGNSESTEELFEVYYPELRGAAQRIGRGWYPDPAALVHDSFVALASRVEHGWQGHDHFISIALRNMQSLRVDRIRARSRIGLVALDDHRCRPVSGSTPQRNEASTARDAIAAFFQSNPEGARLLVRCYVDGLSKKQVALEMGISHRSVNRKIGLARTWIRGRAQAHALRD